MITFGEWLPDQPVTNNPGSTVAVNVIPHDTGYKQMLGLTTSTDYVIGRARGAIACKDTSGNVYIFTGDDTTLYRLIDGVHTDYSKTGGYSCGETEIWQFIQWGNTVIGTNYSDPIQQITLGATQFADLSADAPKARSISVVKNFVVLGNTFDTTDGSLPYQAWWSAIEDPNSWPTPGTQSAFDVQSDKQPILNGGGAIMGIVGGEYGTIIQERAITRMDYVGGDTVFAFNTVEQARGSISAGSIVSIGRVVFYLSEDGFYMFDAASSKPIGAGKVDKYFFADLDTNYYDRISAAVDIKNKLVCWAYPNASALSGIPNRILMYHWPTGKWSIAYVTCNLLVKGYTPGYTLDGLDAISSSVDALAYSLDSRAWTGGTLQFAAYDATQNYATFSGSALSATLETPEVEINKGMFTEVQSVKPYIDGGTVSIQLGTRNTLSSAVSYGTGATLGADGEAKLRSNARFHRIRASITGGFTDAVGADFVETIATGRR